jgi:hypothetical protein
MFDNLTISKLGYYVYGLINPLTNKIFYIGKGTGNRVFAHKEEVLENKSDFESLKKLEIKEVIKNNLDISHIIIRHGLTEKEAYLVEATLIDYHNFNLNKLTNEVLGHDSNYYGIKTSDELIRQYNAPKLERLLHNVIIININKQYALAKHSNQSIYNATKESWVISERRIGTLEYALSEYQGIIIAVFKINRWYPILDNNGKSKKRWGFEGEEAPKNVLDLYLNKSIAHTKRPGAANPIRYNI